MALLILEQLDLRVAQQWINMAAITPQRISTDTTYEKLVSDGWQYIHGKF